MHFGLRTSYIICSYKLSLTRETNNPFAGVTYLWRSFQSNALSESSLSVATTSSTCRRQRSPWFLCRGLAWKQCIHPQTSSQAKPIQPLCRDHRALVVPKVVHKAHSSCAWVLEVMPSRTYGQLQVSYNTSAGITERWYL